MSATVVSERRIRLRKILPGLAWKGITNNGTVYYPYFGAGIFSVFTYFVFSSILHNDIISILPRSGYAWVMLEIGRTLLGIILLPFLFYANSFLIKRRKREIGLYSILGLEKRHIGFLFLVETVLTYGVVVAAGIGSGTVLSKLLFLILLRMTGVSANIEFVFYPEAFAETAVYFLWIYALNLLYNLMQVGKSRPAELLSGSKKGEREPRLLGLYAVAGIVLLALGYHSSIKSRMDSFVFTNFFLAVFEVVVGTYLLFTSGSVAFLKLLKQRKGFYYRPANFITVSGMLNRMKKNAASLANICIFSTMVIITLTCTCALYLGLDGILYFKYPFDMDIRFTEKDFQEGMMTAKREELEEKYGLQEKEILSYRRIALSCGKTDYAFGVSFSGRTRQADNYQVDILLAEDYSRMEERMLLLDEDEVAIYSEGADFGYDKVVFMGKELAVKEELPELGIAPKAGKNSLGGGYFLLVRDEQAWKDLVDRWLRENAIEDKAGFLDVREEHMLRLDVEGGEEGKEAFVEEYGSWCQTRPGYVRYDNNIRNRKGNREMMGGLLFIGMLFSLIFLMCLILIMYYKQISEGYEDREKFVVMQKVGMSNVEIRGTVHKQILLVFYLPMLGAILHTAAGLFMVDKLFGAICFYDTRLLVSCAAGMMLIFAVIYGLSYWYTARVYYGIVNGEEG